MERFLSSGIPTLDNLMGGILQGDNVVWILDTGTYFDYFSECFLTVREDNVYFQNIYVSFDFPPQKILARYQDYFDKDDFILVDAFTFGKGKGDEFFQSFYQNETTGHKPFRIHCIKDLSGPAEFIKTMSTVEGEFKEKSLCKYVFDSLTGMQELWGEKDARRFFTYTCPKLFELEALAYWPLARDAHSKSFLANISHITQLVIGLSFQKDTTCTARFLKMEGRPSQLLNVIHYYNFKENKINFLEPSEQKELKRKLLKDRLPYQGSRSEKIPSFLLNKDSVKIGGCIRDFRLKRNLTQTELAGILNITPSALSQIEHNQSLPSLQLFVGIARFFGKSLDSFFN